MSLAPRRSSSPIRKPSRTTFFRNITRAATYPSIHHPFPISPDSCFTDDTALEQLLSNSLPVRPSSPSPAHSVPRSPTASDVTQFPFLLPDPIQPVNNTDTMSISNNNSHRPSSSSGGNNSNNNNNNNRNNNRRSNTNATPSRINNRRRRPSNSNTNETNRRRTSTPNASLRCDICLQYYSRRDNLRAHQRVHTGDRPYQCRFCAQRFRWLGALRNHEANHQRDGDQPLNPPPPGARQPTASSSRQPTASSSRQPTASSSRQPAGSSSRQPTASSSRQPTSSSSRHPTASSSRPVSSSHSADHQRSRSSHPSSTSTHRGPPSSSHRSQHTPPAQQRRPSNIPNLEIDLGATHGAHRHVLVIEGEPQVSPLYTGSQDSWDHILDDIQEDRSRD